MRRALLLMVVMASACGAGTPVAQRAVITAPPSPPAPFAFELVEPGRAGRAIEWASGYAFPHGTEDTGAFAYAQRKTALYAENGSGSGSGSGEIGWLEPGARVGLVDATADTAEVALFAWTGAQLDQTVRARARTRDLGASPPTAQAVPDDAAANTKLISGGQRFRALDGTLLGYTFCGPVTVLGEEHGRQRAQQREDGVVLDGQLDWRPNWQTEPCPREQLISAWHQPRGIVYHGRTRAYPREELPPGLVAAGPFTGPTFAQLAAKRTTVYWLVDDRDTGPTCQAWKLSPRTAQSADDAAMVTRGKLADGETYVVTFGLMYGDEVDTHVTLLGPNSETSSPRGGGHSSFSMGCGEEYALVANDAGVLTMHAHPASQVARILAYDPRDTEHWYLDRSRCEQDAAARRQRVALAFDAHHGCG